MELKDQNSNKVGIIIVDHGSRREEANEMLHEVARRFRERTGAPIVEPAHMELAEPSIAQAFARCVEQGAQHIVVSLFFLSPGRHSAQDIPEITAEAAAQFPGVTYSVSAPLGPDMRMIDLLQARIQETLGT